MSQTLKPVTEDTLTEEQVASFLREHPDFFEQRPDLLESIQLPDPDHGVTSLTMRQIALLRQRNGKLQNQLENLLDIARENDALFGRMQNLTLSLMECRSIEDLFATLDQVLRECFSADSFAIRIIGEGLSDFPISDVFLAPESAQAGHFSTILSRNRIKCGHPTQGQAETLFGQDANQVFSVAIIPFRVHDRPTILAIGSHNPDRFHPSMGSLFLSHLGDLVARRLDGLINDSSTNE